MASMVELQGIAVADALAVLSEDHRRLAALFKDFFAARSEGRRADLVPQVCRAVKIHMRIEREVFLPACAESLGEPERWSAMAGKLADLDELADELLFADPGDVGFSESAFTLARLVAAHIESAEKPGGVFAQAAASSMNLFEVGERLSERRDQLTEASRSAWDEGGRHPASRSAAR